MFFAGLLNTKYNLRVPSSQLYGTRVGTRRLFAVARMAQLLSSGTFMYVCDHTLCRHSLKFQQVQYPGQSVLFGTDAPVYCLDLDASSGFLAAGVEPEVHIARRLCTSEWLSAVSSILQLTLLSEQYASSLIMPKPEGLSHTSELQDTCIRPRAVHFLKDGQQLIVSYLCHGIMWVGIEFGTLLTHFCVAAGMLALALNCGVLYLSTVTAICE